MNNDYVEDYLMHHGVKGMKWGIVNSDDPKERAKQYNKRLKQYTNERIEAFKKYNKLIPKHIREERKIEKLTNKEKVDKAKEYLQKNEVFNKKYELAEKQYLDMVKEIDNIENLLSKDKDLRYKTYSKIKTKGWSDYRTTGYKVVSANSKKGKKKSYNSTKNKKHYADQRVQNVPIVIPISI